MMRMEGRSHGETQYRPVVLGKFMKSFERGSIVKNQKGHINFNLII